uniref:(northern house mosquito) hypothetical protein n=1 Tax=Culex pipiens TaxID=7175 RepID=A0A8D7ZUS2_CULPI
MHSGARVLHDHGVLCVRAAAHDPGPGRRRHFAPAARVLVAADRPRHAVPALAQDHPPGSEEPQHPNRRQGGDQDQRLWDVARVERDQYKDELRRNGGLDGPGGDPERAMQREGRHLVLRGGPVGTVDR